MASLIWREIMQKICPCCNWIEDEERLPLFGRRDTDSNNNSNDFVVIMLHDNEAFLV